jgi:hypothetical protein
MLRQESDRLVDSRVRDDMVVIQDQRKLPLQVIQFVDQGYEDRLWRRWLRSLQERAGHFTKLGGDGLNGGHEISYPALQVIIARVQR